MNKQIDIIQEISKLCGNANKIASFGWHFVYNNLHYIYVADKEHKYLRFSIPHLRKVDESKVEDIVKVINETNREVKFIKAVILNNGSISICYDHKLSEHEDIARIVTHMIRTLDFASSHLNKKFEEILF